jgi:hypothetical protein
MQLQEGLWVKQLEKGQHHKVFEESFDAKTIKCESGIRAAKKVFCY